MKRLFIIGSGGFAKEVAWLVDSINQKGTALSLAGFVSSAPAQRTVGAPLLGDDDWAMEHLDRSMGFVIAIGNPGRRQALAARYEAAGFHPFSLLHPAAHIADPAAMGPGSIICAGVVVCPDVRIGRHVILNLNSTVGHDAMVGDFVTISPGVNISGQVKIGQGVEIGSGAAIIPGVSIGRETVLGAGAVAIHDLDAQATYVGVPARKVRRD